MECELLPEKLCENRVCSKSVILFAEVLKILNLTDKLRTGILKLIESVASR